MLINGAVTAQLIYIFVFAYANFQFSHEATQLMVSLLFQLGDLQSSYNAAKRAVDAFKEHVDSKELLKQLKYHFALL